jgi:Fe-S-cluster containining protein
MSKVDRQFYANGLQFQCQGSGQCCRSRGEYAYVYLTKSDLDRLSQHMQMTIPAFIEKYCEETDGHVHLKEPCRDCLFLDGARCRVYEARPVQCRTWPFWPSLMNKATWEKDVLSTCPGAGQGKLYSSQEIEDILWGNGDVPGV